MENEGWSGKVLEAFSQQNKWINPQLDQCNKIIWPLAWALSTIMKPEYIPITEVSKPKHHSKSWWQGWSVWNVNKQEWDAHIRFCGQIPFSHVPTAYAYRQLRRACSSASSVMQIIMGSRLTNTPNDRYWKTERTHPSNCSLRETRWLIV